MVDLDYISFLNKQGPSDTAGEIIIKRYPPVRAVVSIIVRVYATCNTSLAMK